MFLFEGLFASLLLASTIITGVLHYDDLGIAWSVGIAVLAVFVLILLILHLKLEGISFLLFPAYILYPAHFALLLLPLSALSFTLTCILVVIQLLCATLSILLPVPQIPLISGPYHIGTKLLCFDTEYYVPSNTGNLLNDDDEHKDDTQPKYQAMPKQFYIRIWYPIATNTDNNVQRPTHPNSRCYRIHPKDSALLSRIFPNSSDFEDGYNYTIFLSKHCRVNSQLNSPPFSNTSSSFPLLIYTHGQNSYPERNTYLIEELASHGFIVAAPYHDDRSRDFPGPIRRRQIDLDFTIKFMMEVNRGEHAQYAAFANTMDLSHGVALFGHSMGGMASVVRGASWRTPAAIEDLHAFYRERVRGLDRLSPVTSVVALDAWFEYLDTRDSLISVDVPMILCSTDGWRNYDTDHHKLTQYLSKRDANVCVYEIKMKSALHSNPTDFAIYHRYKFGKQTLPKLMLKKNVDIPLHDTEKIAYCDLGDADSRTLLMNVGKLCVAYFKSRKDETVQFDITNFQNDHLWHLKQYFED